MHTQRFRTTNRPTSQTLKSSTKSQILTLNSPSITFPRKQNIHRYNIMINKIIIKKHGLYRHL
jgi:hypothetical protein